MPKSKSKLDLNIKREVTQRILDDLPSLLQKSLTIVEKEIGNDSYESFSISYLLSTCFTKYVDERTDSPAIRRNRAIVKWLDVERRNERTNYRLFNSDPSFVLRRDDAGNYSNKDRVSGWMLLTKAASFVRSVLGVTPPDWILDRGSFSGGATTSRKRGPETHVSKFVGVIDATPRAFARFEPVLKNFESWTFYEPGVLTPRLVKGNVLFTVPKTAVIDRVACKEPDVNIFCQKAVGDFIRNRLRRKGRIDLNDQSINRGLALEGSKDGSFATIDLSSASDSLSDSLVNILLPREWYDLLSDLRCPKTFIDGKSHSNEMFSSMGNGFTFELESLVFWALARALAYYSRTSGKISVYGDDIIVPGAIAPTLIRLLSWVGFRTNIDKTFVRGPFRESCGGHYYRGLDATPFYLRRPIKDVSDLILFLNQFRKWLIQTGLDTIDGGWTGRNLLVRFWYSLAALVPKPLWGGYDESCRTQLVSKGPQQCELLETTRSSLSLERRYQIGMYLSRLCVYNKRDSDQEFLLPGRLLKRLGNWEDQRATQFSGLPINSGRFVMRRCKVVPAVFGVVRPLFACEQ